MNFKVKYTNFYLKQAESWAHYENSPYNGTPALTANVRNNRNISAAASLSASKSFTLMSLYACKIRQFKVVFLTNFWFNKKKIYEKLTIAWLLK